MTKPTISITYDDKDFGEKARRLALLEAAVAYGARGWAVHPTQGKVPRLDAWTNVASSDEKIIRDWWKQWPADNIGVATGSRSGIVVLDVDVDLEKGIDGGAILAALVAQHGPLPITAEAHTGRGGRHLYFKHPGRPVKSSAGVLGVGLDVRGDGGQVIAPPSLHSNGNSYAWLSRLSPDEVDLAELPAWIESGTPAPAATVDRPSDSALTGLLNNPPTEGQRHDWLTRVAGSYAASTADFSQYAVLVRVANASTPSPLPDREVESIVTGIWAKEEAKVEEPAEWETPIPFDTFDLPAFPTEVLPKALRDYVHAEAEATQTPEDLVGVIVLGTVSAAVRGKIRLRPQPGWTEPPNLYLTVALESANRKSPVLTDASASLVRYEAELLEQSRTQVAHIENEREILKKRIKDAQKDASIAEDDKERLNLTLAAELLVDELEKLKVPPEPRLVTDSVTPEKLASMLVEQGGALALMSAEPDLFEMICGRYSSSGPNLEPILKGHSGDALRIDRMSRRAEIIESPTLTVVLAVQPEVLRGLIARPHLRGRGVLARFLYSLPISPVGYRAIRSAAVPTRTRQYFVDLIDTLLRVETDVDSGGRRPPMVLKFEPAAETRFDAFQAEMEAMLARGGELESLRDWGGKAAGAVVRLAGILHMAEYDSRAVVMNVTTETLESAISLGHYFIAHAKAAFSLMGADEVVADAEHILNWLLDNEIEHFERREVYRHSPTRFPKAAKVDAPLRLLVDRSFIREVPKRSTPGKPGRKPGPSYEVNPQLLGRN